MKVAVFGGSGFVGDYIINELLNQKNKPYVLVRHGSESKVSRYKECKIVIGDLDNPTAVEQTMMNTEAIIYNIGIIREFKSYGISFEKLHFDGLVKCVEQAKKLNIKRFILMSANGVDNNGTGYQITKLRAEKYLKESGLEWTIMRPSLIFGDSNGKMEFCSQLKKDMLSLPFPAPLFHKGFVPFKAGSFEMSPVHVEDVAVMFVKALSEKEAIGKTFTLGGQNISWKKIIKLIADASGKEDKIFIPAPVLPVKLLAMILEVFSWFPISQEQLVMLLEGNVCDGEKAYKFFGIENPKEFTLESLKYLKND